MNLSASGLSHLTRVTQNVPASVGSAIGPAPKSGRPRWTDLADLFLAKKLSEKTALDLIARKGAGLGSDDRLEMVIREALKRGAKPAVGAQETTPIDGITIKSGRSMLSLSVRKSGSNAAFAMWLEDNLADIITKSYAEFTDVNPKDDT